MARAFNISTICTRFGVTQKDIATTLEVNPNTVSRWAKSGTVDKVTWMALTLCEQWLVQERGILKNEVPTGQTVETVVAEKNREAPAPEKPKDDSFIDMSFLFEGVQPPKKPPAHGDHKVDPRTRRHMTYFAHPGAIEEDYGWYYDDNPDERYQPTQINI